MSFFSRLFRKNHTPANKPSRPDAPLNKIIKKVLFYGFIAFTTATIISKKHKTSLIYTFQPNQQNKKIIDTNPAFHQGTYLPTYYMFFGPVQRFYAKYLQQKPYFRPNKYEATQQVCEIYELPIHDKHSKRENVSLLIIVSGCQGMNIATQKMMIAMTINGFKTFCINTDDFHNTERLAKTINHIKQKYSSPNTFSIGVDYGANLLVNYAAQNDKTFTAIASVGNPLNLQQSEKNIQNSNFLWKKLLYEDMLNGRIKACQNYKKIFNQTLKINQQFRNIYQLDKACYSHYNKQQEYSQLKQRLSSINSIKHLKQPSLFIQSQQDPFAISIEQNQQKLQNAKCIFVESQRGGHLQWFQSMRKLRWVTKPIAQYFKFYDGR